MARDCRSGAALIGATRAYRARPVRARGNIAMLPVGLLIVLRVQVLTDDEWFTLRDLRLAALQDSPGKFLSRYERESVYGEDQWRAEFARGEWTIVVRHGRAVGLLGATRDVNMPPWERYFEYMWIAPGFRRSGIGSSLISTVLRKLFHSGVVTVWLWILDGNEPARRLYERCGFVSTHERKPLAIDPSRAEERMKFT
jgi:ribosomal protein S18 acetylase RimI-like enzyme